MRRAPIVLAATVAGLAGTLGFKTHAPQTTATAAVTSTATGSSSGSGSSSSTSRRTSTSSSSTATVTSDAIQTMYGDVQLKVTFERGKISAIENLALPSNDPHSVQIANWAGPQLQQSALQRADGQVDAVSGATYTSNGYAQALQSALDQAGLASSTASTSSTS